MVMDLALLDKPFYVADWLVEPRSNRVSRGNESHRVEPKAMQVLLQLASNAGHVVTREELEARVWANMVVGPDALTNAVIKLRRALNDKARDSRIIETIPKTGYRLLSPVREPPENEGEPALERRLSAVLYADVAGYSRLVGDDEERTHRILSSYLDFFSDTVRSYQGTVVHYAGDAILAEFGTVTQALGCAAEVQRDLDQRDRAEPDAPSVLFRIGINLGEVIVDRNDIYGDGVNVAARLEGLADPGGICISESVRSAIGKKLPLDYEFMGEQSVKNIAEPVRAYRVLFYPTSKPGAPVPRANIKTWVAAGALVLVAVVILLTWKLFPFSTGSGEPAPTAVTGSKSEKPTIAVLPFANVSVDPEEEYFANGMTDDIITDMTKVSGLYVISASSAFAYKDKAINVEDIGRELGAGYILEGSVRRDGERVRINVQLVDAGTGRHLWAERYDREYESFFKIQDDVVAQVVSAVSVTLTDVELSRIERLPTGNLLAYDYYIRAEQGGYIHDTPGLRNTINLYQKAVKLDPQFSEAYAGLARAAVEVWRQDVSDLMPGARARVYAYDSASKALEIDPTDARAYSVLAILQLAEGHHEAAVQSARKAAALAPGDAKAHLDLGFVLAYSGQSKQGVAEIGTALHLNPKPALDTLMYAGIVFFVDGQLERATDMLSKASVEGAAAEPLSTYLAAAYALTGRVQKARAALKTLLRRYPQTSIRYLRARDSYFPAEVLDRLLKGLKLAGLPEWPYGFNAPESDRLGAEELRSIVTNRTWVGQHENGVSFIQEITENGDLAYRSKSSFETGTAAVRDGMLCEKFEGTALSQELCGYVYHNPKGSHDTRDDYIVVTPVTLRYFTITK